MSPRRRLSLSPAVAVLTAVLVVPTAASVEPGRALDAALSVVRTESICADVHFLASEALEGRDTPSRGLRVAARYLRASLERLGWQPGAGDSYFQEYDLWLKAIDGERSHVELARGDEVRRLSFGRDYLFSSWEVGDQALAGTVVTCGTGTRPELDAVDVAGKWGLCLDSERNSSSKRKSLLRAGAKGMIVLPADPDGELARIDRLRRQAEVAQRGRVELPPENAEGGPPGGGGEREVFHQLFLTGPGARTLRELVGDVDLTVPGQELELVVTDRRRLPGDGGRVRVENVCALLPGSDPKLREEVILVSAHYDHDGVVGGVLYPGADDNASGSSGLLALAEALAEYDALRRSVMLIWVSGEEKGLFGSAAWVREPTLPPGWRALCDINIDMIGRNAPGELYITPSRRHREHNGLVRLTSRLAPMEGFPTLGSADRYYDRSDHANFARLDIPVAFLFNGEHEDYHQPTDTPDKVDCDKIRRVVRLVLRLVDALQVDDPRL